MFNGAVTIGELKARVIEWEEILGSDAPVGIAQKIDSEHMPEEGLMMEWIFVNAETREIVGTEAEDYETRLKPGEISALLIR